MKTPLILRTSYLALALWAAAAPAIDFRWKPDPAKADPVEFDLYRGETARLLPDFGCTNIVAEALCWQTNGMGSAWWTVPGSTFAPANDCGAPRYRFFVRGEGPDGASYRANGVIRMLGSPGATPNELPLPVRVLDFAGVSVTNAPWTAEIAAATNAIPAPDLSAYLPKSGGTMTGNLYAAFAGGGWMLSEYSLMTYGPWGSAHFGQSGLVYQPSGQFARVLSWPSASGTMARIEDIAPLATKAALAVASTAATNHADAVASGRVSKTGDTMTGALVLQGGGVTAYNSQVKSQNGNAYSALNGGQLVINDGQTSLWLSPSALNVGLHGWMFPTRNGTLALTSQIPDIAPLATKAALAAASAAATNHADAVSTYALASAASANGAAYIVAGASDVVQFAPPPDAPQGRVADWLVYVNAASGATCSFAGFAGANALYATSASATNTAVKAGVTAFAFTQIADGAYMVSRQELTKVGGQ